LRSLGQSADRENTREGQYKDCEFFQPSIVHKSLQSLCKNRVSAFRSDCLCKTAVQGFAFRVATAMPNNERTLTS
jgi:hypothetical protein